YFRRSHLLRNGEAPPGFEPGVEVLPTAQAITSFIKAFKAACRKAGCPGRIPHDLRRTAGRNLVRLGIPQTVAMKQTGHKTDRGFRRYDIVSANDLRVAAERLDMAQLG